jgi:membrane associated rhomboid family serine protease
MLSRLTVPGLAAFASEYFYLRPVAVVHGQIWQLVTYSFLHDPQSVMHLLFNMLGLWMFGAQFEMDFGTRKFYESTSGASWERRSRPLESARLA